MVYGRIMQDGVPTNLVISSSDILFQSYFPLETQIEQSILSEWWDSPPLCCQRKPRGMRQGPLRYAGPPFKRDCEQFLWLCYHVLFSDAAHGADLTIESDTGYTPMALAVALGHKKSKGDFFYISFWMFDDDSFRHLQIFFHSSERVGELYFESLQAFDMT